MKRRIFTVSVIALALALSVASGVTFAKRDVSLNTCDFYAEKAFQADEINKNTDGEFEDYDSKEPINTDCAEFYVDVPPAISYITLYYGDINGDSEINSQDVELLCKFVAGQNVEICNNLADVNCDDVIDGRDIILIAQYIKDNSIILGPLETGGTIIEYEEIN